MFNINCKPNEKQRKAEAKKLHIAF